MSGVVAPSFWTSALDRGKESASHPCCFTTGGNPRHRLDVRRGGPQRQSNRYEEEKIMLLQGSELGRPAHSPSLYWLSSPALLRGIRKRTWAATWFRRTATFQQIQKHPHFGLQL